MDAACVLTAGYAIQVTLQTPCAANTAAELGHRIVQAVPQIFRAGAVRQEKEGRRAGDVVPDNDGGEASHARLGDLPGGKAIGSKIDRTELRKHPRSVVARDNEAAMAVPARNGIAGIVSLRRDASNRLGEAHLRMDGRENKDLRRRKPRNQRSVRLQLRAVVAAGQDCAVAAEPCGDAASLQSPARNDRQVDQLEPSITGRWTLRQSGVAAISKGETGLPQ